MIRLIEGVHPLFHRILPCVGIAVHCDAGLAVPCDGRGDVCIVGRFVDVCDDGVPESVACGGHLHLLADASHHLPVLCVGQGRCPAEQEITLLFCLLLCLLDVRQGDF